MKLPRLIFGFVSVVCLLSTIPSAKAISSEKAMRKGQFVAYTGPQRDWPRSDKHVAPVEVTKYGIVIFDQLPDRPYEVVGTVSAKGDLFLKHASQAALAAGGNAILVVGDKAFGDAGIQIQPRFLKDAQIPDPNATVSTHRLDRPDQIREQGTQPMIRESLLDGIVIRWKLR
jgi:hypothetical protein